MSRTKKSAPADKEHAVTNQTAAKVAIAPLRVEGDMTIYQAAELKQTLLASLATTSPLVLDLSAVSEIDTSGVQLLMMAAQYARACGQECWRSSASTSSCCGGESVTVCGCGPAICFRLSIHGPIRWIRMCIRIP